MGDKNPSYGLSAPIITFSSNLRSSLNAVSSSLPRIISYLPLVDSSTWHFHITILVALNNGNQKSMFIFFEVVNLPSWVSCIVFADYFDLIVDVSLPITTIELLPLSDIIWKLLNFSLPILVFIQPCRIGE